MISPWLTTMRRTARRPPDPTLRPLFLLLPLPVRLPVRPPVRLSGRLRPPGPGGPCSTGS